MAYPGFFRKKVLRYRKTHGATLDETAEHFKIGRASIARWAHKPEPTKTRNKPPVKINDEDLLGDVKKHPDSYCYERAERFGVTASGIGNALKRLKISYKKNVKSSKGRRKCTYQIQANNRKT